MKIAIVVHGRFHAFDLARELLKRGHEVTLFTNYPKWAVETFGIPKKHVRSFWIHGILSRLFELLHKTMFFPFPEAQLHTLFGRWTARQIRAERWDVVHCWSGISEESRKDKMRGGELKLLMRGSAHIRTQACILEEEEKRIGRKIEKPSKWIIAREEREYSLADNIVVLSSFAYQSFINEGVPKEKLRLLPLGARIEHFRPSSEVIEIRTRRILSGEPLRVLYVGTLSYQKGLWDMMSIFRRLGTAKFQFRLVGPQAPETKQSLREVQALAELVSKTPQAKLPQHYQWGDLFIFPTIQDGFAVVLAQAKAACLPILTTTNCAGPDLISEGETGWILPIRNPKGFIDRLQWCDEHRKELAEMVKKIYDKFQPRDWSDVARDFEQICKESLENNGT